MNERNSDSNFVVVAKYGTDILCINLLIRLRRMILRSITFKHVLYIRCFSIHYAQLRSASHI